MISFIKSKGKNQQRVIAVAAAEDAHVLQAVKDAADAALASFVLVGDKAKIVQLADNIGLNADVDIIDCPDTDKAAAKAVALVADGKADALMKGLLDTSAILKAALNRYAGIRGTGRLSHLAAFELPTYNKLLFVTDSAINIAPDFDGFKDIINNAVAAVTNLGIKNPKVALLAAKEKPDNKMPITMVYEELKAAHNSGLIPHCILDGPLALDGAISKESLAIKGINSPLEGEADILICPDIEAANILYKALTFLSKARGGGMVIGAKCPIILTSRSDTAETKLLSIALSTLA